MTALKMALDETPKNKQNEISLNRKLTAIRPRNQISQIAKCNLMRRTFILFVIELSIT